MEVSTLRRAGVADVEELVRLRALMFTVVTDGDHPWEPACREMLAWRLADEEQFAVFAFGSPEPGGPLLSSGAGWVNLHLPGPTTPDGRRGHVGSISTDVVARRRGHAGRVLRALLDWFDAQGVTRVDLRAAPMGEGLYRSAGFGPLGGEGLSRFRPR